MWGKSPSHGAGPALAPTDGWVTLGKALPSLRHLCV